MRLLLATGTLVTSAILAGACASSSDGDGDGGGNGDGGKDVPAPSGICADACPKSCDDDSECDTPNGELCCNFGDAGKACVGAAACPRFCEDDSACDASIGLACLQVHPQVEASMCAQPEASVRSCQTNEECGSAEVCCGIYGDAICVAADRCPVACSTSQECNTTAGQVCCTTLGLEDSALAVPGLCVDPNVVACPTACSASQECNTAAGELCCEGVCSTSCAKSCESSNDCTGQICCKHPIVTSVWMKGAPPIGYSTGSVNVGCPTVNNGVCDEPGVCPPGSDAADCGSYPQDCPYTNDGECDEPDLCPPGSDAADCGSSCVDCYSWVLALSEGQPASPCPEEQDAVNALYGCMCSTCAASCSNMCNSQGIDPECENCLVGACNAEVNACLSGSS